MYKTTGLLECLCKLLFGLITYLMKDYDLQNYVIWYLFNYIVIRTG